ncbi:damage-inducible protein CinA [Streptomyces eurocidicus]|uniref:Damage-inducible protein CinA n=1 Tax=Streptomyces eurocidicus TaxID=66423 RepID=A0A2N8NNI7_STREU|nr:nicotinamide-nucleotide amidohydrolase family protein [Streptomyces eurocidicus]MBB5123072.1 nicotinamide-nucleotide amidase [Streptomyces eurocidicus]MBF6056148.1 nicotinamide-nucleotide amidohydrolase family protein [Streptomyces eurocidicus]PNE30328.1 damage-inducible protein CinA [Streptomyces eurocidicus]
MSAAESEGAGAAGSPAAEVLRVLVDRGRTVAAAESLTGGLVAAELTAVPGASRAVRGSVTAYATEVKREVLGVDGGLLAARGAVDGEVAGQMARGVRALLGADWGVATTGVAGPDAQDGKPVGTVFVAAAGPAGATAVRELSLDGDRARIRAESVQAVLELLLGELTENVGAKDTEHNGGN